MEKTHRLRWAEMRPSERRDAAVSFIGQVLKWAFVGAMCIFTLYPVIYTLLGSFKTNAELTLGGGILPEKWQIENYIYAFQKLEFGKYTLNSVVLALLTVLFTVTTASMAAYIIARREFPGKKLLTTSYLLLADHCSCDQTHPRRHRAVCIPHRMERICDGTGFHDVKPGLENIERGCGKSALFCQRRGRMAHYDGRRFHRPDPYFDRIPAGEPSVHHRFDSGSGQRIRQRLLLS